MKQLLYSGILLLAFPHQADSQILYSNGATVTMTTGSQVKVNGGTSLAGNSSWHNNGEITITENSSVPLPGTLTIGSSSLVSGNGNYFVEQDWINDGTFTGGNSTVTLYGNSEQFISSTNGTITQFNNLVLTGTGTGTNRRKTLQNVDAKTGPNGILTLNNRELATETNSFYVLNPSLNAIGYDNTFLTEGFVSSLAPGVLTRVTNTAAGYMFPTGSSVGVVRFRPVELTPQGTNASEYAVRFNNYIATQESFDLDDNDGVPCEHNELFFHSIDRSSGTLSTDVKLFYVSANDGVWSGISHWRTASSDWNDVGITTSGNAGSFATETRSDWDFANPGSPYVLNVRRPEPPVLNCPEICENTTGNVFTLTGTTPVYQWTFPGNGTVASGQGTSSVQANWTTGTGEVSAVAIAANGCTSLPATCTPIVYQSPVVDFSYTDDGVNFDFQDNTPNANGWDWDLGDGTTATIENPSHGYDPTTTSYTVFLTVTDNNGCKGTTSKNIEVFQEILVPNVITPNGDGANDRFEIKSNGLKTFDLVIVNRWGNEVFSTTDPTQSWDGKTNGEEVVDGVYFYQLKVSTSSKEFSFQGNVSVYKN